MNSSVLQAYSILKNSRLLIKKSINGNKLFDIKKCLHKLALERSGEYYTNQAKRVYNDVENNKYGYLDVALFCFHHGALGNIPFISENGVKRVVSLYSNDRLEQDKIKILALNKKIKLKKINSYFNLDSEGKSIIFRLVKRGLISPRFWIEYSRFWEEQQTQEETREHYKFRKCCELIGKQILGGN